jgi:hypothetical protein
MTGWLMSGCWHGICQPGSSQNAPDPNVYESFFRQVVRFPQLQSSLGVVLLNGQPTDVRQYTLQDAIGLTDQESRVLKTIASGCEAKIRASDDAAGPLIFAARLRLIESENDAQAVQQLKEFGDEQRQIVLAHVQQLKASLEASRFNVLDAFVRSGKQLDSFLPLPKAKAAASAADGGTPRQPR